MPILILQEICPTKWVENPGNNKLYQIYEEHNSDKHISSKNQSWDKNPGVHSSSEYTYCSQKQQNKTKQNKTKQNKTWNKQTTNKQTKHKQTKNKQTKKPKNQKPVGHLQDVCLLANPSLHGYRHHCV
jgi:hypothetical protein